MDIYKVIFAKNEVISCNKVNESASSFSSYHYEHDRGKLIYALIKAETEEEAYATAEVIIREVRSKIFGNDFITL